VRERVTDTKERAWRVSCGVCAGLAIAVAVLARARDPEPATIPAQRIDVNSAPAARLRLLEGVGPTLAARIIADRAENGAYGSLEDLDRVPRIGPRTLLGIAPDVSFGPDAP